MKTIVTFFAIVLTYPLTALAFQGWSVQDTGTQAFLSSVKAVSAEVVWACGNGGRVFRSLDGGASWTDVGGGSLGTNGCDGMEALGTDTAFVCVNSDTAIVYRTTNGGSEWLPVAEQPGGFFNAVRMTDYVNGIALGDPVDGRWVIFRTSDGGSTWSRIPTEPAQVGSEFGWVNSLHTLGEDHIWFGTSDHRVYRSTDGGDTWQWSVIDSDDGYGLWFNDILHGVVAGGNGAFQTTDGGVSWLTTPLTDAQYGAAGSGTADFWMTRGERIYRSADRGLTWEISFEDPSAFYWHLSFVTLENTTYGWAVGDSGAIAHYSGLITSVPEDPSSDITGFRLWQNYPNPFNPGTTITYGLPENAHVRLEVFNILGERVSVLRGGLQEAGYHSVVFDAEGLPSGMYFYRLQARPLEHALSGGQAGDFVETKTLILMR